MFALSPELSAFANSDLANPFGGTTEPGLVEPQMFEVASAFREHPIIARVQITAAAHSIDLGAFGAFHYHPGERRLALGRAPVEAAWLEELILGPALLYALAQQQVFALHASSVQLGAKSAAPALALIAQSGTGKSTLAQAAAAIGWTRLADDVLPFSAQLGTQVELRPHFPQLKLPAAVQYDAKAAAFVKLDGLISLERGACTEVLPMSPRMAASLLLRSTLASKLLPSAALAQHLQAGARVAQAVSDGQIRAARLCIAENAENAPAAALNGLNALHAWWTR